MSESLSEKISSYGDQEGSENVYTPVKDPKIEFDTIVEEALLEESIDAKRKNGKGNSTLKTIMFSLMILIFLSALSGLCYFAYIFTIND
jgi:hypothetical protein